MSYRTAIVLSLFLLPVAAAAQPLDMRANPDRMEQRIKALSAFGANSEGGVSRVAFSEPDLPAIMFGSHIDSVPGGGNYDGDESPPGRDGKHGQALLIVPTTSLCVLGICHSHIIYAFVQNRATQEVDLSVPNGEQH